MMAKFIFILDQGNNMPRRKGNKAFLHLYIDKNILERAKRLIPNLSAFVEAELAKAIILAGRGLLSNFGAGREGFEPPTAGLRVPRSSRLSYRPLL